MSERELYVRETAEAILTGRPELALIACANDPDLSAEVSDVVIAELAVRSSETVAAVDHGESWWIRSQLGIWSLAQTAGAPPARLADALLHAIGTEAVSGQPTALDLEVGRWLAQHDRSFVAWLADSWLEDEHYRRGFGSGGRFLFAALFAMPGREGAEWLPVLCGFGRGTAAAFAYQDMAVGKRLMWADEDWAARFDALSTSDAPAAQMLDFLWMVRDIPVSSAPALSRLVARYSESATDSLFQGALKHFRAWRTGDPTHDASLFRWSELAPNRHRLAELIELSGSPGERPQLLSVAVDRGWMSDVDRAALAAEFDRPAWADGEVPWVVEPADSASGQLHIPDGRLCAGDPIWGTFHDEPPVEFAVPPGLYKARVIRAEHPLRGRHNVAAEIVVRPNSTVKSWIVAPGRGDGSFFVENGRGALGARFHVTSAVEEDGEEGYVGNFDDHVEVDFVTSNAGDMVAFAVSPQHHTVQCWVGIDEDGYVVRFVAELGILEIDPTQRPLPW